MSEAVIVNGVAVDPSGSPSPALAAVRELLRQRALALGLVEPDAAEDEIAAGIEALLDREVALPSPTEAECRRYYDAHPERFTSGDLVFARHILFQVTPGSRLGPIREQAESTLAQLVAAPEEFAACALTLSNCPSGRQGGNLGQIGRGDTVPEFEKVLFRLDAVGLLPELVKTRFGFHIVAVDRSIPGDVPPFEAVRERVAEKLRSDVEERALQQYVSILASQAKIVGAHIEAATSPLVQ